MEETTMTMAYAAQSRQPRRTIGDSPRLVFYEVAQVCDRFSNHCRDGTQPGPHPAELTTQQSLRLIDELTEFPVPPRLILTGGDPFKRADIFELVNHAARKQLDVAITLSAAPLMTPTALRRLRCAGIAGVAVSIDGADSRTHDAVRGTKDSYYRSLQILNDARAEGIATQVNTTITPANLGQIDRMAELFARAQIDTWSVFFLVPVGRAHHAPRLSAAKYEVAFERLYQQSLRQPYRIITTDAPQYRRFVVQHPARKPKDRDGRPTSSYVPLIFNDGKGVMFVSHVGLVHPSRFMPILCGIFPLQHLVRIYQDSPIFRKLRDVNQLEGKCRLCEFRHICGGSRARAYAVTGNPFAEEPDCAHVPEAMECT
jgi:MoaA/NifB/PqqE/SkfB family radical SAM enzyme